MSENISLSELVKRSVELAEKIQTSAEGLTTKKFRKFQELMSDFISEPEDKIIFTEIIDRGLRIKKKNKSAERISAILKKRIPGFIKGIDYFLTQLFKVLGRITSFFSLPVLIAKVRSETEQLVLSDNKNFLAVHIKKRQKTGAKLNVNHIGEVVLGEGEADRRFDEYLEDLDNDSIEYLSVKISSILPQMQVIAYDHNLEELTKKLKVLFKKALSKNKYINLDMEEYKNIDLTVTAFMSALDDDSLKDYMGSIALQSYIPESFIWQEKITQWAKERISKGGSPVKIRLVKGANLEMESFESAIKGWPLPIYGAKIETDANYKTMVEYGLKKENAEAVSIGIASHNIFDISYGFLLAQQNGTESFLAFELIEGMADPVWNFLSTLSNQDILLYGPVVNKKNFINAMAYLVRRMDESTADENFLRYSFDLEVGSKNWEFLRMQFIESFIKMDRLKHSLIRLQNRNNELYHNIGTYHTGFFFNEPDTDWSIPENRQWAKSIRDKWMVQKDGEPFKVPLVLNGQEIFDGRLIEKSFDKSRHSENITAVEFAHGNEEDIEEAVATAKADPDGWRSLSLRERHRFLSNTARELRKARGDLIGAMALNTGKIFTEADVEVSEAVDFAEYYPHSLNMFNELQSVNLKGKGVGLVVPPWNFPVAIPGGGIIAALSSGNTVIIKPSSDSVLPAWILCKCFWDAGISKKTLQFLPCRGSKEGALLAKHKDIDFVIFTGSTDTAMNIIGERPNLYVAAETGGKNGTIVTVMADYEQAIGNIIHSAFSNCGQKCSATSLLVLTEEVFKDKNFKRQLVDAVKTFTAGPAWDFKNRMGPLIKPPSGDLKRAYDELAPGESWLIEPEQVDENPHIWKPSIKWNVKEGSFSHMTEFFGPVLSVVRAKNLDHAIDVVNSTGYGLTSGLESLDEREHETWKKKIRAGNLYINRGTTGAIVLRQPFGGMGKSAFGNGIKAGGPNYAIQFMDCDEAGVPSAEEVQDSCEILSAINELVDDSELSHFKDDLKKVQLAVKSYLYNYENEFSVEKDYFELRGQDNIVKYIPLGKIAVRIHSDDCLFSILARILAVNITGNELVVSINDGLDEEFVEFLSGSKLKNIMGNGEILFQSDEELCRLIPEVNTIRYDSPEKVPDAVCKKAAETGFYISRTPVLSEGRIELLQYLREQSISYNYHRYGNLGRRGLEL